MGKLILLIGIALLVSGCTTSPSVQNNENIPIEKEVVNTMADNVVNGDEVMEEDTIYYQITGVVDGDTIKTNIDGKIETIRLIGIDTPETVDPRKPVQCFGQEASNKAKEWLLGKTVELEADPTQGERDKYDRLLRYVKVKDGMFYNLEIIKQGYAFEYTYNTPYKYQDDFKNAEKYAKNNKLGLWADNACPGDTVKETPVPDPEPTPIPIPIPEPKDNFSCSISKNCGDMVSCDEAYYYLNTCGKSGLDRDKDGVPCEDICK